MRRFNKLSLVMVLAALWALMVVGGVGAQDVAADPDTLAPIGTVPLEDILTLVYALVGSLVALSVGGVGALMIELGKARKEREQAMRNIYQSVPIGEVARGRIQKGVEFLSDTFDTLERVVSPDETPDR